MVGIGDGAMFVLFFKNPMIMAKDRIEGVAESSGLSWCAAVQCSVRQCVRQPTSGKRAMQCSAPAAGSAVRL